MSRRSFPHIDPADLRDHADEGRVERVWDRIEHDLASRLDRPQGAGGRRALVYVAMAATFAAFGGGLLVGKATWDRRAPSSLVEAPVATPAPEKALVDVLAAGSQPKTFPLEGGVRLTLMPGATAEVERAGGALTIALLQGGASADAPGRKALSMTVGDARINTQGGGAVSVTRREADFDVHVDSGTASVVWPDGTKQELARDERSEKVPLHAKVASAPVDVARRPSPLMPRSHAQRPIVAKAVAAPEWYIRSATDEEGALALLRKQGVDLAIASATSGAQLMVIADIMRHKGRDPAAATRALHQVVDRFPADQNAFVAANNLADIYQSQGKTDLAEKYRGEAHIRATLSDAFSCNQISEETDKTKAAQLAMEYLRRYPNGQCHEQVQEMVQPDDAVPPAVNPAPAHPALVAPAAPAPSAP